MQDAEAQRDDLARQVQTQQQENDALAADIAEGATDEKMQEIAREELGLIAPNERVFPSATDRHRAAGRGVCASPAAQRPAFSDTRSPRAGRGQQIVRKEKQYTVWSFR